MSDKPLERLVILLFVSIVTGIVLGAIAPLTLSTMGIFVVGLLFGAIMLGIGVLS